MHEKKKKNKIKMYINVFLLKKEKRKTIFSSGSSEGKRICMLD